MLKTDLLDIMRAVTDERLSEIKIEFENKSACCVILASKGYPLSYEKGFAITADSGVWEHVYVAGAKLVHEDEVKRGEESIKGIRDEYAPAPEGMRLVNSGGRVLGCTAVADTLKEAVDKAYKYAGKIHFANAYYRKDIGARALAAK